MSSYESAIRERWRASNGRLGMAVDLGPGQGGGTFWSKGWRGCEFCGGDAKGPANLKPFMRRANGETTVGWRCR